jgi:hypothetical protein
MVIISRITLTFHAFANSNGIGLWLASIFTPFNHTDCPVSLRLMYGPSTYRAGKGGIGVEVDVRVIVGARLGVGVNGNVGV